jgi:hypothetical protein
VASEGKAFTWLFVEYTFSLSETKLILGCNEKIVILLTAILGVHKE